MPRPAKLSALLVTGQFYEGLNVATVNTAGAISPIPFANMVNAVYNRDCNGAARQDTTDSAANILAQIPGAVVGTTFVWYVRNTTGSAQTLTIAAGAGVTITGTATVAQSAVRTFLGVVTGVGASAAITLYSLGSQAY